MNDVAALRSVAEHVAIRAAALVRDLAGQGVRVSATKSSGVDVVTEVDRRSEELIRSILAEVRPDDGVLGEEEGATAGTSGVTWIVDPVDGTVNLLYGIAQYAVSVAARVGDEVVAGAVVEVTAGTLYSAGLGLGASKDGVSISVRRPVAVEEALVLTGFGYRAEVRAHQGECVARLLPQVRDIRRMGSCALDLCHLAEGLADGYVEDGPQVWDHAAGGLVLREAGGRFDVLAGPLTGRLEGWSERSVLVGAPATTWDGFVGLVRRSGFVL